MTTIHTAEYQTGDLSRLVDFIYRIRKPEELPQVPTGVDFEEMFVSPEIRESTRLWLDERAVIVGYAMLDPRFCNLFFEVDPQQDVMQIQKEMIAWGIDRFRQLKNDGKVENESTLDTNCDDKNEARIRLLEDLGFILQDLMTLHLSRDLSEPIPQITLPDGFVIRPVAGEDEADALVELYHAAYGSETMTRADVLAIMRTSSYERELDLVATAPDGRLAGLCSCGIETALNEILPRKLGSTDPVLVHPDFQSQGLARALIWSGWEKLKSRGIEVAELGTSSHNEKGIAAFTRAGYRIDTRRQWFAHPVS